LETFDEMTERNAMRPREQSTHSRSRLKTRAHETHLTGMRHSRALGFSQENCGKFHSPLAPRDGEQNAKN